MRILSIETSCDDTCISILEAKGGIKNAEFELLANNSNSQINVHIPYGGVYPVLAKREHQKNLPIVLEETLREAAQKNSAGGRFTPKAGGKPKNFSAPPKIDLIAVTYGPGLEMCLWEGIVFARDLAKKWPSFTKASASKNIPIIPVNHMEGHVLSVFGKNKGKFTIPKIQFPALALLVSGGHTQLVLMKDFGKYEIAGETLDDAVGEAFDKVARMLDLPYPGGPEISRLAEETRGREKENQTFQGRNFSAEKFAQSSGRRPAESPQSLFSFSLPRPMLHSKNFNFSFAGLKTAVLYLIKKIGPLDKNIKSQISLEFENAAIECLVYKTEKAVEKYKIKTLIVAGGVACNKHLQSEMKIKFKKNVKLFFPPKGLAGDNSIMIGIAGYLNYIKNKGETPKPESIKATGNLRLI